MAFWPTVRVPKLQPEVYTWLAIKESLYSDVLSRVWNRTWGSGYVAWILEVVSDSNPCQTSWGQKKEPIMSSDWEVQGVKRSSLSLQDFNLGRWLNDDTERSIWEEGLCHATQGHLGKHHVCWEAEESRGWWDGGGGIDPCLDWDFCSKGKAI